MVIAREMKKVEQREAGVIGKVGCKGTRFHHLIGVMGKYSQALTWNPDLKEMSELAKLHKL